MLPLREFNHLLERLEELEDICLFDAGKRDKKLSLPADQTFKLVEAKRKKRQ